MKLIKAIPILALVATLPMCSGSKLHIEEDGVIRGEAEDFSAMKKTGTRKWYLIDAYRPGVSPDPDKGEWENASGGTFLEVLPDTRVTHADELVGGENFSNEPGKLAILEYRIRVSTPGRYYVWVRAFSTGTEDNGIHVGLDGRWPESGQRMQWCEGKNRWSWDSRQRTQANHCGEAGKIYLDIETAGEHTLMFSMREDGFAFDSWQLSPDYVKPGYVFPGKEWQPGTPAEQGVDPEKLQEALDYLESHSKHNGNKEVVVIRNGYLVFAGEQADSSHNIWSCSKTFTSTVLGLLVDEGRLSLDDPAAVYEPLLREYYPRVTFRHFATMTSGYSAVGGSRWEDAGYADWSHTVYHPDKPYFPPGKAFAYWDEAQMMFGRVLTQVLGRSMQEYLTEKVTDPVNMGIWHWYPEKDLDGIPINNGCTNVFVNARQLARWGWLFLNKGNWNGQQLISESWVDQATRVQVADSIPVGDTDRKNVVGPGCYGFNWWVNGKKADGQWKLPGAPAGCYFASGLNNNKCIVIPQWDMVVVRMGEDGHPEKKDAVYGRFLELLAEAISF